MRAGGGRTSLANPAIELIALTKRCGKSTTLRMIAGHGSATSRCTAMMFQRFALFPHLGALDNVAFSLKMKGVDKAQRHARA